MSAEFEKIVLEKFDELNLKITELSEEVHELKGKVDINTNSIINLSEKVENNSTLINNLSDKVECQGLNFAKFENDFNIKVQGLFDSFVANTESHLAYDKFISALNAKTYDHNIRISVLEDYFKNAKLLSTT